MSDYNLTTKQQEIWATQVGPLPRGIQKKIAEALSKKHGDVDGWRTRLSQFFQGRRRRYARCSSTRAGCESWPMAAADAPRSPGLATGGAGVPLADGPFDMRVPGRRSCGALPDDAFYAPPQRETRFHLPFSRGTRATRLVGEPISTLVGVAARNVGDAARVIVVVGSPGQGRTPLMKALGARMAEMDLDPAPWAAGGVAEGAVVIADDIDLMTPVARARLLAEVVEAGRPCSPPPVSKTR
ncbi:MAG: hypothetical protein IPN01_36045 [Deltaproteobacteria bacterium]|nr:hypothetical protein [Deltaproteobacteria bacterium]